MNWFKYLNESLDYIEEHLTEEIDLHVLALKSYSSYHHFLRMFYVISGITMGEYIRKRRLSLAANDIITSKEKIIDIAYKYQYKTPESFSKAFKEFHSVSPSSARKYRGLLKTYSKLSFQLKIGGTTEVNYKMVHKENLNFQGYSINVTSVNGENFKVIPKFWQDVMSDGRFQKLIDNHDEMGVVGICYDHNMEESTFKYMIGVRNTELDDEGVTKVSFEPETFAAFEANGALPKSIQDTTTYIYNEWFPSSNYEHTGGPEFELYPQGDASSEDYVCYYWIPIKQK